MVDRLGKYEILRTLGRGAMGEVYLAHHPVIGREVAIKTILASAQQGADAEARFRREATAAGQLNHPNLVTIYDFDRDGEILYLVMEYVKGEDLEELIRERDLTQAQYLEVLAQVCDGLAFAHKAGIIHRDIKPANIRVVREGKRLLSKVMDFGIARTEDSNMTSTGIVMGTVSYMAPEYIQSGKATVQADLWAVGVMLYECLAGRKPFHGENTTTVLFKIVSETPRPLEPAEIHGVSTAVRAVLEKALSKDPSQRFLSAEAFAKALRASKDPAWTGSIEEGLTVVVSKQEAAQVRAEAPVLPPTAAVAPQAAPATAMVTPLAAPPTQVVPSAEPGTTLLPVAAPEPGTTLLPVAPVPEPGTTLLPMAAPEPGTTLLAAAPAPQPGTVMLPPPMPPPAAAPVSTPVVAPPPAPRMAQATATPSVAPPTAPAGGNRGLLFGGIGAGVVALGVGGWLFLGRKAEPEAPALVPAPVGQVQTSTQDPGHGAKPPVAQTATSVPETKSEAAPSGKIEPAPKVATPNLVTPAKTEPPKPEPAKAEPAKVEPAKPAPAQESPDQQLQKAEGSIDSDPRSAIPLLKALSLSGPGSQKPRVHAAYLTALYRARSIAEFERAYDQAGRMGFGPARMMQAFPPFKAILAEESRLKRQKQEGVIPEGLMRRMVEDIGAGK